MSKEYFVAFYDSFDGWTSSLNEFDDVDKAIRYAEGKQGDLDRGNVECGEHYSVFETENKRPVWHGDRDYKPKNAIKDGLSDISNRFNKIEDKSKYVKVRLDWLLCLLKDGKVIDQESLIENLGEVLDDVLEIHKIAKGS